MMTFLSNLDSKANDYFIKLNKRYEAGAEQQQISLIVGALLNYSIIYENLSQQASSVPQSFLDSSGFSASAQEFLGLLNASLDLCYDTGASLQQCSGAAANYQQFDSLLASMAAALESYNPTQCTAGQTQACTTTGGESGTQQCVSGAWSDCVATPKSGTNYYLVGVLAAIIIVLVFLKFFRKRGAAAPAEASASPFEQLYGKKE